MKKILNILLVLFFLVSINVYASDYTIEKYDIEMNVNENNSFDITETITANFYVPKHGIYRDIPKRNTVERLDGTTSKNKAKISNISVNEEYTKTTNNGNIRLKIGSPYETITGSKTYTIKYNYKLGKDPLKDKDELYLNLIGLEWDAFINNVSFKITMPKEFDKEKLGFSYGPEGSTEYSDISYYVNGLTIIGNLNRRLNPKEGLTIRLELDDGYFSKATNNFDIMGTLVFLIPSILILISYLLWRKYGKDDIAVETVEFYPPEGLNSAEIQFLHDGGSYNNGITSLLIYLANKGYIKIKDDEDPDKIVITKLKDYDGTSEIEKKYLEGLFEGDIIEIEGLGLCHFIKPEVQNGYRVIKTDNYTTREAFGKLSYYVTLIKLFDESSKKGVIRKIKNAIKNEEYKVIGKATEVTVRSLEYRFYETVNDIEKDINKNKEKIFVKSSLKLKVLVLLFILPVLILGIANSVLNMGADLTAQVISSYIGGLFGAAMFGIVIPIIGYSMKKNEKVIGLIYGTYLFVVLLFITFILREILVPNYDTVLLLLYSFICTGIIIFLGIIMKKRTAYGVEILGKINGFKRFLEVAEKEKIESLVKDNPNYFFDILPFTYALNISDTWIKKFEQFNIEPPSWYDGDSFSATSFNNFLNDSLTSMNSTMNSSPSSDSSGGSGGGSSGGGSGGGGGGSW